MTATLLPRRGARLPDARGELSAAVLGVLRGERSASGLAVSPGADPLGEDLQLALYLCYELHYRGFAGVEDDLEWDPELLRFRAGAERSFLCTLRDEVAGGSDVSAEIDALLVEPVEGDGPSWHLLRDGSVWQLREYVAHRSLYHLKEADPQSFVVPRLDGATKAAVVTVQHDEYGAGRPERLHATLFAQMMTELDLDPAYGTYLDAVPGATLATVNLMSLMGLHRSLRGALLGQFSLVEITSPPGSARLVRAMQRLGLPEQSTRFYAEHIEADAVHEQIIRRGVLAPLLAEEPDLAADVVFGIQASTLVEDRLAEHLCASWRADQTSLRRPI